MIHCRLRLALRKAIEHVILAAVDGVKFVLGSGCPAAKPATNKGISAKGRFCIFLLQLARLCSPPQKLSTVRPTPKLTDRVLIQLFFLDSRFRGPQTRTKPPEMGSKSERWGRFA